MNQTDVNMVQVAVLAKADPCERTIANAGCLMNHMTLGGLTRALRRLNKWSK
jgi:hypothetical protein